jgi:tripeptidyl-peptidase-1
MRFTTIGLSCLAVLSSSLAAPNLLGNLLNAPSIIPAAFQNLGAANPSTPFTMTFHINSANLAGLASRLESSSDQPPGALSEAEIASYAAPTAADLTAVQTYLRSQGFADSDMTYSLYKDQITVPTTVSQGW